MTGIRSLYLNQPQVSGVYKITHFITAVMDNHLRFRGSNRRDPNRSNGWEIMSGSTIDRARSAAWVVLYRSTVGNEEMAFDRESGPSTGCPHLRN